MKPSYFRRKWNRFLAYIKVKLQEWKSEVNWLNYWHETRQRHHDYIVFMHRQGKLDPEDKIEYETAMAREKAGEVKPLPDDATSPFG